MAEGDENKDNLPEDIENRLAEMMKSQIEEAMASRNVPTSDPPKDSAPDPDDEVRKALSPFIQPGLDDAKFRGDDAKDFASFYLGNPDASSIKDEVEKRFIALAQAGRPTTRDDIYKHIKGQEYVNDPNAFIDKEVERRQKELERINSNADMGLGSLQPRIGEGVMSVEEFEGLSVEEMEEKMEGFTF